MHPYNAEKWLKQIDEVIQKGPYTDSWESLMEHKTPQWFQDAKFGIFIHWGIYSVPAYNNEWYPRNVYVQGTDEYQHHVETYGPHKTFGYKDFIPQFTAEKFDPKAWVSLFKEAGARYVVPVAEHHDGFQMYQSELSHWNSAEMGPKRDLGAELAEAIQEEGMINGASSHRIEHWFFLSGGRAFDSDVRSLADQRDHLYWPSMPVPDSEISWNNESEPCPTEEFLEDFMIRTVEIIDRLRPKELYFDWWVMHRAARPYMKKIAAYYYNRSVEWGCEVLLIDKMGGFMTGTATRDMERGGFSSAQLEPWQTDTAIAKNSWCYTEQNIYKKPEVILRDFVDAVAKNGTMLLNVGPKADGTISDEDVHVLKEIGRWMHTNAEAIYESRPFITAQEGPTVPNTGAFADAEETAYTSEDFRFTLNHGRVYAIALVPDQQGTYLVRTLGKKGKDMTQSDFHGIVEKVDALDKAVTVTGFQQTKEGLMIQTETDTGLNARAAVDPVVFRITIE